VSEPKTVSDLLDNLPPPKSGVIYDNAQDGAGKPAKATRKRTNTRTLHVKRPKQSPWERHGIRSLSASSLRLFREQPAAWVVRYMMKIKSDMGPPVWRGTAVEAGLDDMLLGSRNEAKAVEIAKARWDQEAMGDASDKALKEYEDIPEYLHEAIELLDTLKYPTPMGRQIKVNMTLDEIDVPIIGYIDYGFLDHDLDLKTTGRMPSQIKPEHLAQMSVYFRARKRTQKLLYVTPKKAEIKEVTKAMADEAWDELMIGVRAINKFLHTFDTPEEALSILYPDFDAYQWDAPMIEAVKTALKKKDQ
jgi:hypothetical protein